MKISFVVPAHNQEATIGRCLDAIVRTIDHSHIAAEIIVVDNASNDHTPALAKTRKYTRIIEEPLKGHHRARRTGFAAAAGELIAHIEPNVILPQGWISNVLDIFADPQIAIASGPLLYEEMPTHAAIIARLYYGLGFLHHFFVQHVLRVGAMIQDGNFVIRSEILKKIDAADEDNTVIAQRASKEGSVAWRSSLTVRGIMSVNTDARY